MFTNNLYERVLIDPAEKRGADQLLVVSGYASALHAFDHLQQLNELECPVRVELIVGMTRRGAVNEKEHAGFTQLCTAGTDNFQLTCSYVFAGFPVHSKVYVWLKKGKSVVAYLGSVNYTASGFKPKNRETCAEIDPKLALEYFHLIERDSCDCLSEQANQLILQFKDIPNQKRHASRRTEIAFRNTYTDFEDSSTVTLSLLAKDNEIPKISGINWGQRSGRNPNQAYLAIPAKIYRESNFFPARKEHFFVLTDDNEIFVFARAQDNGKALHTPQDNSLLGRYLRDRLGVESGQFVTKHHLEQYGRTDITFTKVDDKNYLMDFSVYS